MIILSCNSLNHRIRKRLRFVTVFGICLVLLSALGICSAAEAECREVALCEVVNSGFRESVNQAIRIKQDEDTGNIYYDANDLEDAIGISCSWGESAVIYNYYTKSGSSCVMLANGDTTYELFERFFHPVIDGRQTNSYSYDRPYLLEGDNIYLSDYVLSTVFDCACLKNGNLFFLDNDPGKFFPGTHGLTLERRKAIEKAMFILYAKDRDSYEAVMRYKPSFMAVSPEHVVETVGWKAGAFVNFDLPIMNIEYSTFQGKTELLAGILVHEAWHWAVGYQGNSTETIPVQRQIQCLLRIEDDLSCIQRVIDGDRKIMAYYEGALLGQSLLDAELQLRRGREEVQRFLLPLDEKTLPFLGKILLRLEDK